MPPSQSMPLVTAASSSHPHNAALSPSPVLSRANRYRTHSDGDRDARYADSSMPANRSPVERHVPPPPPFAQESRSTLYGRPDPHGRPYSSAGALSSRHDMDAAWSHDDRADAYQQDRRMAWEASHARPIRPQPEPRAPKANAAATRCRRRAALIAVLARPPNDTQRLFVKSRCAASHRFKILLTEARLESVSIAPLQQTGKSSVVFRTRRVDLSWM